MTQQAPRTGVTRRGLTTFAVGVTAGALAYAGVSGGMTARVLDVGVHLVAPPAAAGELPEFDDCAQLRRWYVRTTLPRVGPWGLGGGPVMTAMGQGDASASDGVVAPQATGAERAVGSSATGTTVQEPDVDEADVAKTDGRLLVRLTGPDLVVTDVTGAQPRELSRLRMPGRPTTGTELLLHDGHAVVVGAESVPVRGGPVFDREGIEPDGTTRFLPGPRPGDERLHLLGVDLTDPAAPRVTSDRSIDGRAVSLRQYAGGVARLVVTTGTPPLDFVQPNRDRTPMQATRLNRDVVRSAPVDAWLPGVRTATGSEQPLVGCSQVRHPVRPSGPGTLSVATFPVDDPGSLSATAVTASGDLAYSSGHRLYLATRSDRRTTVHAFALDAGRTSYVASARVPGTVKDRWSFDEHDGRLRVATTLGDPWNPSGTDVVVLAERSGRLVETGRVAGLGRGEQVKSVRWFGNVAVVVTFRQTDPLHTVDLSDPDRPRLVGTLKVPGFSSYLHPVGGDLLVGVGRDASTSGVDRGAQVSTFDLHDLADVRRTDTLPLGRADLPAGDDPRLLTYLPSLRVVLTPVQRWDTATTELVALHVDRDGRLSEVGSWDAGPSGTTLRTLPLGGHRIALAGDDVRLVDVP
jgi:hypothetical protein